MKQITFILIALIALTSKTTFADETAAGVRSSGGVAGAASELPKCIDDADQVAHIVSDEKGSSLDNGSGKKQQLYPKYRAFERALVADSETELMARLVYSETRAAKCSQLNSKLVDPIAAVVANRVAASGNARTTVFAQDQFASSLNIYDESEYKQFLCPSDSKLWAEAVRAVQKARQSPVSSAKGYYLFQHFADKPEKMAKYNRVKDAEAAVSFPGSDQLHDCLRLYPH